MARTQTLGIENAEAMISQLGRPAIRRIVEAGAKTAAERMRANMQQKGHVRTGDLMGSVAPDSKYYESLGGGAKYVYPQGDNPEGQRRATIAYVINYGRGKRKSRRMGDKFITGDKGADAAVAAAMQAESDRIMAEIGK